MDIQVAVLCDAATDYKGKLNLLGTFNSVYTRELPANYPVSYTHLPLPTKA